MNTKAKRIIKGVAKCTGKYTLKAIGKGLEFAGRGTIKTVHALSKSKDIQKVMTAAGLIGATVAVAPVVGLGVLAAKYVLDKTILEHSERGIVDEITHVVNIGNKITEKVSNKISPTLGKMDKGVAKLGQKYQDKIDDIFR